MLSIYLILLFIIYHYLLFTYVVIDNRPNSKVVPNSNPLGIERLVSQIFISFKFECHLVMQMQYTKNLIPWRFELGTKLSEPIRAIEIITIRDIAEFFTLSKQLK